MQADYEIRLYIKSSKISFQNTVDITFTEIYM